MKICTALSHRHTNQPPLSNTFLLKFQFFQFHTPKYIRFANYGSTSHRHLKFLLTYLFWTIDSYKLLFRSAFNSWCRQNKHLWVRLLNYSLNWNELQFGRPGDLVVKWFDDTQTLNAKYYENSDMIHFLQLCCESIFLPSFLKNALIL